LITRITLVDLRVTQLDFNDMADAWSVTFWVVGNGEPKEIWTALGTAENISLTVGKRLTALPHTKDMDRPDGS
jgi:hypothetical protein